MSVAAAAELQHSFCFRPSFSALRAQEVEIRAPGPEPMMMTGCNFLQSRGTRYSIGVPAVPRSRGERRDRGNIGALLITYVILGVPYYSRMGPKTLV